LTIKLPLPFRSSRPLGQGDALLPETGVALDVVGIDLDDALHQAWRARIEHAAQQLRWPVPSFAASRQGNLVTLMFTAPANQLQTAREVNEWALCAALVERDPSHWSSLQESLRAAADANPGCAGTLAELDETFARARLTRRAAAEALAGTGD
jgi:hypothetical protein